MLPAYPHTAGNPLHELEVTMNMYMCPPKPSTFMPFTQDLAAASTCSLVHRAATSIWAFTAAAVAWQWRQGSFHTCAMGKVGGGGGLCTYVCVCECV